MKKLKELMKLSESIEYTSEKKYIQNRIRDLNLSSEPYLHIDHEGFPIMVSHWNYVLIFPENTIYSRID